MLGKSGELAAGSRDSSPAVEPNSCPGIMAAWEGRVSGRCLMPSSRLFCTKLSTEYALFLILDMPLSGLG